MPSTAEMHEPEGLRAVTCGGVRFSRDRALGPCVTPRTGSYPVTLARLAGFLPSVFVFGFWHLLLCTECTLQPPAVSDSSCLFLAVRNSRGGRNVFPS